MFRPVLADRKAVLAVLGLVICGAYVAGGLAAVGGLEDTAERYADRFRSASYVAYDGASPFDSSLGTPPAGVARVALLLHDAPTGTVVVASVTHPAEGFPRVVGTGPDWARGHDGPFRLGNRTLATAPAPPGLPGNWIWIEEENLTLLDATPATVWLVPPERLGELPAGVAVAAGSGLPDFAKAGLRDFRDALWFLVAGTALVVLLLASNVAYLSVQTHARDLRLVHAVGGSAAALTRLATWWMARVVAIGISAGAAAGVVLVSAAFALAPVVGVTAVGAARVDPARFALALAALGLAALGGAWWGSRRAVRGLLGAAPKRSGLPAAVLSVAACLAVFATVHLVLASAIAPPTFYAEGAVVVRSSDDPVPMRSLVPSGFAATLEDAGAATAAAPEILLFTTLGGEPIALRGAPPARLLEIHGATLTAGAMPRGEHEILLGERLAERLGLAPGSTTWLAGGYRPMLQPVTVAGVFRAPTLLSDEAVAHLALARTLGDTPAGFAQIVEARAGDEDALLAAVEELKRPRLEIEAPRFAEPGAVPVVVRDQTANAAPGVAVAAGAARGVTSASGAAILDLAPGRHVLTATRNGSAPAQAEVVVLAPVAGPAVRIVNVTFAAPPVPGRVATLHVLLHNFGNATGTYPFDVVDDRGVVDPRSVTVAPRSDLVEPVTLRAPEFGTWTIHAGDATASADLDLAGLATQWRLADAAGLNARAETTSRTVEAFVGNVAVTSAAMSVLTILLVSVGIASVATRKVWERGEDLALLRFIGAKRSQVQAVVLVRVVGFGAVAAALGLALGTALAWFLLRLRPLTLFGHELPFIFRTEPLAAGFVLAIISLVASALFAGALWLRAYPGLADEQPATPVRLEEAPA